jgi:hypothetical protein
MSLADFDERDLERLADYLAGVVDGPSAADVERLIRTDSAWAQAHATLIAADAAVRAQLRAYGTQEPMPGDIAARMQAALDDEAARMHAAVNDGAARLGGAAPAGASVVSLDAARARRRRRLAGLAAAAVALVAVGTGAVVTLSTGGGGLTAASSGRADTAQAPVAGSAGDGQSNAAGSTRASAPLFSAPPQVAGAPVEESGTNYTAGTLAQAAAGGSKSDTLDTRPPGPLGSAVPPAAPQPTNAPPAGASGALSTTASLAVCVSAITAVHPGQVQLVDLARYNGQPAVIVVVRQANATVVVAAGARCGVDGPDELATATA